MGHLVCGSEVRAASHRPGATSIRVAHGREGQSMGGALVVGVA